MNEFCYFITEFNEIFNENEQIILVQCFHFIKIKKHTY